MSISQNLLSSDNNSELDFDRLVDTLNRLYGDRDPVRIEHLELTASFSERLSGHFGDVLDQADRYKLRYASMGHDLLKGKFLSDSSQAEVTLNNVVVPVDLNRYVRLNLPTLEPFQLDDYFNTDIQLHALAAGIYLIMEFGITDTRILYPIFFHSCPILSVYEQLDDTTRLMVDLVTLADKLSSNHIKRKQSRPVPLNLELSVFGESNNEFNFTQGLLLARLLGQGRSTEKHSREMSEHYYQRLVSLNPFLGKLGGCPTIDMLREVK